MDRDRHAPARAYAPTFAGLLVILACGPSGCAQTKLPGKPDEAWDSVFARSKGWTGGDVAATVDLGDQRTLWLFGDSWFGAVESGRHSEGSRLVNNSIAVHPHLPQGAVPQATSLSFLSGPPDEQGQATAWVVPSSAETSDDTWFWTSGGGAMLPGPQGKPRLAIFLFHVGRKEDATGIWNFESVGGALALIDNPTDAPQQWLPRVLPIPFAHGAHAARSDRSIHQTSWGVATHLSSASETDPAHLYLYGIREASRLNKQLLLARVPPAHLEDFDEWRFFSAQNRWSKNPNEATAIADNMVNELSVSRHVDTQGHPTFLMVHSEPLFGEHIFARTAPSPEGPWTAPKPIYAVPDIKQNENYFTYAAKAHPHLSRPGELLVTYLVNSHDFGAMVRDASIYRPRFVRVPLTAILP